MRKRARRWGPRAPTRPERLRQNGGAQAAEVLAGLQVARLDPLGPREKFLHPPHSVFEQMVEVVAGAQREFGRPRKLSVEDQVLLSLCYWREYRSQFHGSSFGLSCGCIWLKCSSPGE